VAVVVGVIVTVAVAVALAVGVMVAVAGSEVVTTAWAEVAAGSSRSLQALKPITRKSIHIRINGLIW
jgi:hypothetical protein